MAIDVYNLDPNQNTAISGIDIGEGASPAGMNDALRQLMADLALFNDDMGAVITSANAALAAGTVSALVDTRVFATQAALYADLAHDANDFALVYADPDPAKNDLYVKSGASGTGSWSAPLGIFALASAAYTTDTVGALVDIAEASAAAALASASALSVSDIYGTASFASGTTEVANTTWVFHTAPFETAGTWTYIEGYFAEAGVNTALAASTADAWVNATAGGSSTYTVPGAGYQRIALDTPIVVTAGQVPATFSPTTTGARLHSVSGAGANNYKSRAGLLAGTQALTAGSVTKRIQFAATVVSTQNIAGEEGKARALSVLRGSPVVYDDPVVDSGSTTAAGNTFLYTHNFVRGGWWKSTDVYCKTAGRIKAVVATLGTDNRVTKVAAREIHIAATGAQTLTIDMAIPKNGMIGFYFIAAQAAISYNTTGVLNYSKIAAELTGTMSFSSVGNIGFELDWQHTVYEDLTRSAGDAPNNRASIMQCVDWNAYLPPGWKLDGDRFTLDATGLLSASDDVESLSLANVLQWPQYTTLNRVFFRNEIVLGTGADAKIAVMRRPFWSYTDGQHGTLAEFDFANARVGLAHFTSESTTSGLTFTWVAFGFTPVAGRKYVLQLENHDHMVRATIHDTTTAATASVTVTEPETIGTGAGLAQGMFGLGYINGEFTVKKTVIGTPYASVDTLFLGDSISAGTFTTPADAYSGLIEAELETALERKGTVAISAQGGSKAQEVLKKLENEIIWTRPKRCVLWIGTNDTVLATWQANMAAIKALCDRWNVDLIICDVAPVRNSWTGFIDPDVANPWLDTQAGWRIVHLSRAFTTGNTGLKADRIASLIDPDVTHPNPTGHLAAYAQIKAEAPELFDYLGDML